MVHDENTVYLVFMIIGIVSHRPTVDNVKAMSPVLVLDTEGAHGGEVVRIRTSSYPSPNNVPCQGSV